MRHAFDPDHLVAVTTIVSAYRNPLKAIWVGVSWGLGHTTTLLGVGVLLLFLKITLPEQIVPFFEVLVGVVLVILGIQVFWSLRRSRVHLHPHGDDSRDHLHFHSHDETPSHAHHPKLSRSNLGYFLIAGIVPGEHPQTALRGSLKPFFRLKSYIVGTVHGLAGSAALLLLVLAAVESRWLGVWYILLFGLGSVVSMGLITIFLALPFSASARLPWLNRLVQYAAGTMGVLFGFYFMYEAGRAGLIG